METTQRVSWRERIGVDLDIHHGEPCIRGTRIPATMILGSLADGMTYEQILDAYPQVAREDIAAVMAYAAEVLHDQVSLPLPG